MTRTARHIFSETPNFVSLVGIIFLPCEFVCFGFFTSDRSCVFSIFTPSVIDSLFASEIKGKINIFLLFFILNLVWFVFDLQNFNEK